LIGLLKDCKLVGSFPESADFIPDNLWHSFGDEDQSIWLLQLKLLPNTIINMVVIMLIWIVFTPVVKMIRDITFLKLPSRAIIRSHGSKAYWRENAN
jgi:hypothetical protein